MGSALCAGRSGFRYLQCWAGAEALLTEEETMSLNQGDYLVVPAGVQTLQLAGESFHLVECLPPAIDESKSVNCF
jgi:quercetin dioxygenase-like cupin family protein